MFPLSYQEIMKTAKKGKLGKEIKTFLCENPDGALDCSQVLLQCTSCGKLDAGIDLSMYVPADKPIVHKGGWSSAFPLEDTSYIAPWELKEHYRLVKPFDHTCRKCGCKMRVIKEQDLITKDEESIRRKESVNINCPKCRKPLTVGGYVMWD